ncbi:hypothetical protein [Phenylobacterium sp.]|uniref:hypothetical protein n=1 Tax=Phenylobacterium sp. TaxID=1871053 RepID=UPI0035B47B1C
MALATSSYMQASARRSAGRIVIPIAFSAAVIAIVLIARPPSAQARLDSQAQRFVTLALSLGRIDPREVDAYFGPAKLTPPGPAPSLDKMDAELARLRADILQDEASPRRDRLEGLTSQLAALVEARRTPNALSFDEETRRLYHLRIAPPDQARLAQARAQLEALLPGPGDLPDRLAAFRDRYVIPADKRQAVFTRALAECRARTLAHWPLPADERVDVDWSRDVDAAWQRYQGGARSTLQINPDSVAYIGSALDVACHEAYPGHHAQFLLQRAGAGAAGPLVEDTVVLLRSPQQVLREGAAEYGVEVAFPLQDRAAFQRDVLFPLAGFPPDEAAKYVQVHALARQAAAAAAPILRDYHDGRKTFFDAAYALETEALIASPRALLEYEDRYGAYAASYGAAADLVARCVEARRRGGEQERWSLLRDIVADGDLSALSGEACAA